MNTSNREIPLSDEEFRGEIEIDCIEVKQPIGSFYSGSIKYSDLISISRVDTRRIVEETQQENGFETLLGIQRRLSPKREKELQQYVNTYDACFPTAIILSIPERCAQYIEDTKTLVLKSYKDDYNPDASVSFDKIASVLDGQHRIAGLKGYHGELDFEVNVSIFLELDPALEAYIFSVVNQAQTKVNKSLVYDLYSLATSRSPQRLCHQIAVALNQEKESPFHNKIKRLGSASPITKKVAITQAAFVEALLRHISFPEALAVEDRDKYMRNKKPRYPNANEKKKMIFRELMLNENDALLTAIVWNYFDAVARRWPDAWYGEDKGQMLSKTNGFMALFKFLRDVYLHLGKENELVSVDEFLSIFIGINIPDDQFNVDVYKPGGAGESALYRDLKEQSGIVLSA